MRDRTSRIIRVGVDTGGTFTDLVAIGSDGRARVLKVPSTPEDPALAVIQGLAELGLLEGSTPIVHGTTVGTNALLQRRGGRVALVATEGFEDLLILGRQARRCLYRLDPPPPKTWIPGRFRIGIRERCGPRGEPIVRLTPTSIRRLRRRLRALRVEAVAVCLLHSYADPANERRVARALRPEGWHLSLSHRVANEFREFERTCTTVANATLARPLRGYLQRLGRKLGARRVRVMASSGGWISAARAAAEPVRTVLSGPAGGALGAALLGRLAGFPRLLTLDMGGTSTDLSLCDGEVPRVHGTELDGIPLRIPALDIRSVGAGGGSIARMDSGGALRVGPESAGAEPGPACYARGGTDPTLTDAHLILGRLPPEGFLNGKVPLDGELARGALGFLAGRLGLGVEQTALGVLRVADATLERSARAISAGRGQHPARYALLAFGGAGGLHACALASALGIRRILVPPDPGTFSALGLCCGPATSEASRTVLLRGRAFSSRQLANLVAPLERATRRILLRDGQAAERLVTEREADLRYAGQSHELTLPLKGDPIASFHRAHFSAFGYQRPGAEVELVTLRVRSLAPAPRPALRPHPLRAMKAAPHSFVMAVVNRPERRERAPYYRRENLEPGHFLRGPAIVGEYSATTFVAPGFLLRVDPFRTLVMRSLPKAGR